MKNERGFSLLELLFVMGLFGVMATYMTNLAVDMRNLQVGAHGVDVC